LILNESPPLSLSSSIMISAKVPFVLGNLLLVGFIKSYNQWVLPCTNYRCIWSLPVGIGNYYLVYIC